MGGIGVGCCNDAAIVSDAGCTGFNCGDRMVGAWMEARPGVLLRVTRLCVCLAVLSVLGAVGLLESVGSTLGASAPGSSTLGGC